jgi:hypothetical protein
LVGILFLLSKSFLFFCFVGDGNDVVRHKKYNIMVMLSQGLVLTGLV